MIYFLIFLIIVTGLWLINLYISEQCPKEKAGYRCHHNKGECGYDD